MDRYDIYRQIAERTGGDIYMGVVGPVRTGKSTLIQKFMELMVLPEIENEYDRERAQDEMPLAGSGKTIMTTQPRFVPNEAISIKVQEGGAEFKLRMVDCVGYLVNGAMGHLEGEKSRMVKTPWNEEAIPFEAAAETGTRKVITEHSTIGMVVTTDGSFTDIPRANYIEAEERVIRELKEYKKPFIVILNTANPDSEETVKLRAALSEKYDVPVFLTNVLRLSKEDLESLLKLVLYEFPITEIEYRMPGWLANLSEDDGLFLRLIDGIKKSVGKLMRVREAKDIAKAFSGSDEFAPIENISLNLSDGRVRMTVEPVEGLFYKVLSETCGLEIENDMSLIALMKEMADAKHEYDRVKTALKEVREEGYGMVPPTLEELTLEEPELIKQGNSFGVRLKATAPSLHFIRADIDTEVSPIVGTEKQSAELVRYLLDEFEADPARIWKTDIFGKSLHDLVKEGLSAKLNKMPEDARGKIQDILQKVINGSGGGFICIVV